MTQGTAVQEPEAPVLVEGPECRHHWLIESPHGATSWGICKHCGERREFSNSATDGLWDGEGIPAHREGPVAAYTTLNSADSGDDDGF
jgi:hypothetical protein